MSRILMTLIATVFVTATAQAEQRSVTCTANRYNIDAYVDDDTGSGSFDAFISGQSSYTFRFSAGKTNEQVLSEVKEIHKRMCLEDLTHYFAGWRYRNFFSVDNLLPRDREMCVAKAASTACHF